MSRLLHPEDPLDPGDHLVAGGVGRLVDVQEAGLDIVRKLALHRSIVTFEFDALEKMVCKVEFLHMRVYFFIRMS